MSLILHFQISSDKNLSLELKKKITIGRSSNSDVVLVDQKISRSHGYFELRKDGRIYYKDLGSRLGSYINGSKIMEVCFTPYDIITIGDMVATIVIEMCTPQELAVLGESSFKMSEKRLILPQLICKK